MCPPPESAGPIGHVAVGRDFVSRDIFYGLSREQQVTDLKAQGIRSAGQSGGVRIAGTLGTVAGDIVGGNKIAVANVETFVQGIDAETTAKISETHDDVARVLEVISLPTHDRLMFDAARREAEQMCDAGRLEDASRAFMEALDREDHAEQLRREEHRRLRVRLLEEAIAYDAKALNADAAFVKLRLIAETTHPGDHKAQTQYMRSRGSEYRERGKLKGDNAALLIALSVFSWLAEEKSDAA